MHDDLESYSQSPSEKFHQFWKTPKKFQKPKTYT